MVKKKKSSKKNTKSNSNFNKNLLIGVAVVILLFIFAYNFGEYDQISEDGLGSMMGMDDQEIRPRGNQKCYGNIESEKTTQCFNGIDYFWCCPSNGLCGKNKGECKKNVCKKGSIRCDLTVEPMKDGGCCDTRDDDDDNVPDNSCYWNNKLGKGECKKTKENQEKHNDCAGEEEYFCRTKGDKDLCCSGNEICISDINSPRTCLSPGETYCNNDYKKICYFPFICLKEEYKGNSCCLTNYYNKKTGECDLNLRENI